MKLLKIDSNGLFLEDVITETFIDDGFHISTPCQGGFYLPKWDGEKWIEGKTQEEIEAIINTPVEPSEMEIMQSKIDALEAENLNLMLAVADIYESVQGV